MAFCELSLHSVVVMPHYIICSYNYVGLPRTVPEGFRGGPNQVHRQSRRRRRGAVRYQRQAHFRGDFLLSQTTKLSRRNMISLPSLYPIMIWIDYGH